MFSSVCTEDAPNNFCAATTQIVKNLSARIHIISVVEKKPINACDELFLSYPASRDLRLELLKTLKPDGTRRRDGKPFSPFFVSICSVFAVAALETSAFN